MRRKERALRSAGRWLRTAGSRDSPLTMRDGAVPGRSVELGEDLTDDLRSVMGGERFATFGFGDLGGERFNRRDTADKNVAQRFATRLRIIERGHRRSDGDTPCDAGPSWTTRSQGSSLSSPTMSPGMTGPSPVVPRMAARLARSWPSGRTVRPSPAARRATAQAITLVPCPPLAWMRLIWSMAMISFV